MEDTTNVPNKQRQKANLRGIYMDIAKEFGVTPNTARHMTKVVKSHRYIKKYNELADERLKALEKFEELQAMKGGLANG